MAYTTINKGSSYFNTVIYTGTGSSLSVTGVGFQSDFRWLKQRSYVGYHQFNDTLRGITKYLFSNATDAEYTDANGFTAIGSDGFTVGTNAGFNTNGGTLVAWNWLAGGAGVSNTSGSISSTVSANPTAGFSIVSYTGTGANATVGHGLGVAPKMVICKTRSTSADWYVYHASMGTNKNIYLNSTGASITSNLWWNNTAPTSTVFSVGDQTGNNGSGITIIAYCFADIKGYSKFGSYTGNGSTDGPFVYTGFKPAFVMFKNSTTAGTNWQINDSARDTFNVMNKRLAPSTSDAEATDYNFGDFLSNGFKIRQTDQTWNRSGDTYIYMCFASNPFVTSGGIPVTAR